MHQKIGEFSLIERIEKLFAPLVPSGVIGIGDDCAVMTTDNISTVMTTDILCQDVHFTLDMGGYAIGRRAVMANLSDIAAMGAVPTALFLSISVPSGMDSDFLNDFFDGIRSCDIPLLGGDTTRSAGGFVVNITAMGSAPATNIKLRSGAKVGDIVLVAGELGAQSASNFKAPIAAQTKQGVWLGSRSEVHSMMDISDGLAGDLPHILRASSVGAAIELNDIPVADGATLEQAVGGGEDFVLLLTCDKEVLAKLQTDYNEVFGTPLYPIGTITAAQPTILYSHDGSPINFSTQGYTHSF